jgi:CDP-glucose 4,6-dehydratase
MEGLVVDPAFWRGKRVLVTGHTGFKGSWLSLWLVDLGASVCGFSNGVPTSPSLYEDAAVGAYVKSIQGDVRDIEAVRKAVALVQPEIVFHLAAQALVRKSYARPVETYETNIVGTAHVLECCCGTAASVVVVTSDKCYEPREDGRPHRETDPLGGRDPYSSSKACAELVTEAYRSAFGACGTSIASARAGNVIGGGDWATDRLIPDLMRAALAERPVAIRNPSSVRPWQHVLNPLEGYLLLAQRLAFDPGAASAWNFGPDEPDERPVSWVVERFADLWGESIVPVFDDSPQPSETRLLRLDSTKARSRLGWRPRWNLDDALRRTVDCYRAQYEGDDVMQAVSDQIHAHQAVTANA